MPRPGIDAERADNETKWRRYAASGWMAIAATVLIAVPMLLFSPDTSDVAFYYGFAAIAFAAAVLGFIRRPGPQLMAFILSAVIALLFFILAGAHPPRNDAAAALLLAVGCAASANEFRKSWRQHHSNNSNDEP